MNQVIGEAALAITASSSEAEETCMCSRLYWAFQSEIAKRKPTHISIHNNHVLRLER